MRHHLYLEHPNLRIKTITFKLTNINFTKELCNNGYLNDIALTLQNVIYELKLDIKQMQLLLILNQYLVRKSEQY